MDEEEEVVLEPLEISCTSTDCEHDLHCFLQKKRHGPVRVGGPCRDCGATLVEWNRVAARDLGDIEYTFAALQNELIRHEFFHRSIDQYAINYAHRKGRVALKAAATARVKSSVGRAAHPREGRQTPFHKNPLFYAQHAVAACCRKCIEYWHAIPAGRELKSSEVRYLAELLMRYIDVRFPDLDNKPTRVPAIRQQRGRR